MPITKFLNPIEPYLATIKLIVVGITVAAFVGMGAYIKYQSGEIDNLSTKLELSERTVTTLNDSIIDQNASIQQSNAKYEEVQKQLNEANKQNKKLIDSFKTLKDGLGNKPVPQTCEEAKIEMLETGKELVKKWKK